jgi:hypothetical protein
MKDIVMFKFYQYIYIIKKYKMLDMCLIISIGGSE